MSYEIVKTAHIVFMITWFAGLFYLPRLFVYHALAPADDRIGIDRFKVMERKLYFGIMTPSHSACGCGSVTTSTAHGCMRR